MSMTNVKITNQQSKHQLLAGESAKNVRRCCFQLILSHSEDMLFVSAHIIFSTNIKQNNEKRRLFYVTIMLTYNPNGSAE